MRIFLTALAFLSAAASANDVAPGSSLRPGMGLVYEANGIRSDPWIVDAAETGLTYAGMSGCSRIRFLIEGELDLRWHCAAQSTLYEYSDASGRWEPARPLGPRMILEKKDETGAVTQRFETGESASETIGGLEIVVIQTVVYTLDKHGTVRRRLRERYAAGLGTATGGVFEVPDPRELGGWRKEFEFGLVEITESSRGHRALK